MLASDMTTIAKSTSSSTDPAGEHAFAYPVVREVSSRRTTATDSPQAGGDQTGDAALVALVNRARRGDERAWKQLVDRFDPMLRRVVRRFRLSPMDVDDVVQDTWVRLYSHIGSLRDPAALAGWLATTARRRALSQLQTRDQPIDIDDVDVADHETPEHEILEAERREVFRRAVRTLPDRQRRVVTLLSVESDLDYQQVGELLRMPIGSIGPTRARGLARLEGDAGLQGLYAIAG